MTVTINAVSVSLPSIHSSPKSVLHHSTENIVEQLILGRSELHTPSMIKNMHANEEKESTDHCYDGKISWTTTTAQKRPRNDEPWVCQASKKSRQTSNPVLAVVGQVAKRIRMGSQRADRKVPLSLAVSYLQLISRNLFDL